MDIGKKISVYRLKLEEKLENLQIEEKIKKETFFNIEKEKSIVSNKGFRHENNLKLRGQRTKSTGRKKKKTKSKK